MHRRDHRLTLAITVHTVDIHLLTDINMTGIVKNDTNAYKGICALCNCYLKIFLSPE